MLRFMVRFLERYWFRATWIIFLTVVGYLIFTNNSIDIIQDFPGHLYKARNQPLGQYLQGWNLKFFGGYSEDIYPNAYHWLLRVFLIFLPDIQALQVLTFLIVVLQIIGIWVLATTTYPNNKELQKLGFVMGLLVFSFSSLRYLGFLFGTLYVGGGPAGLGLVIFLFSASFVLRPIKTLRQVLLLGLLIGTSFLTHTISALAVLLLVITKVFFHPQECKKTFESILLGLLIGLPWIWIAINPAFKGSRINMSEITVTSTLLTFAIAAVVFTNQNSRKSPLFIPMITFALLSSIPISLSDWIWEHGVSGIHFYRFVPYAHILLAILASTLIRRTVITSKTLWIATVVLITGTFIIGKGYYTNISLTLVENGVNKLWGRTMDVSTHPASMSAHNTIPYAFGGKKGLIDAEGVFFESSQLGILFYSLEQVVSPRGFTGGVDSRLLRRYFGISSVPKYAINWKDAQDLLGINWYLYTTPENLDDTSEDFKVGKLTQNLAQEYSIPVNIYATKGSDRPLVEPLSYLPVFSNQPFGEWWSKANLSSLFLIESTEGDEFSRFVKGNPVNLSQPQIKNLQIGRDWVTYDVSKLKEGEYAPMFVKFAYNRYSTAIADGRPVPIAKISPGYMLVPSRGSVSIKWETPSALKLVEKLSLAALLGIIGMCGGLSLKKLFR